MEVNESRAKALEWFDNLLTSEKESLCQRYFPHKEIVEIISSSSRIETIWRKEILSKESQINK